MMTHFDGSAVQPLRVGYAGVAGASSATGGSATAGSAVILTAERAARGVATKAEAEVAARARTTSFMVYDVRNCERR